jgi:hypothetical protein
MFSISLFLCGDPVTNVADPRRDVAASVVWAEVFRRSGTGAMSLGSVKE